MFLLDQAKRSPRVLIWTLTGLLPPILILGFWVHRRSTNPPHLGESPPSVFAVSGFSMAPSLRGRARWFTCNECPYEGAFPLSQDLPSRTSVPSCPFCGRGLHPTEKAVPPDQLMTRDSRWPVHRGDWVAIERADQSFVKRVVGIPGDTIDLRETELIVNGQPIARQLWQTTAADMAPLAPVHEDVFPHPVRWRRNGRWWVYHHINPYRGNHPDRVRDDYAVNVGISRQLQPVNDLLVSGSCLDAQTSIQRVVFWTPDGDVEASLVFPHSDSFSANSMVSAVSRSSAKAPVLETHPIAIELRDQNHSVNPLRCINVNRLLVYRLRPDDSRQSYPITLDQDHCFVLGDNVPISRDSRDWGPISRQQVRARLIRK